MKNIEIDRSSWHYKLANYPNPIIVANDLCGYIRQVAWSLFVLLVIFVLGCLFFASAVDFMLYLIVFFKQGILYQFVAFDIHGIGIVAASTFIVIFGFVILTFMGSCYKFIENKLYENSDNNPSFISVAYSSIKNKYCARLTFK